jgi:23S rRNA (uracil1939-C5)-methyltransferase
MMNKEQTLQLSVTDLANKGQGIAHHQGKIFFIDDVLPGDQILVNSLRDHGTWAEVSASTLVQPSPLRRPSPCRYSDRCGGCQWLELPYAEQLKWKAVFIRDAVTRLGKIDYQAEITVEPSANELHYRNRVLLRGQISDDGQVVVGYFRKKSRELIPISRCMIADAPINDLITFLQSHVSKAAPQRFRLSVQVAEYYKERQQACLLITVHGVEGRNHSLAPFVQELQKFSLSLWCGLQEELKPLHLVAFEGPSEQPRYTAPEQFQQVNLGQNNKLRKIVEEEAAGIEGLHTIVDLFCGSGNLSLGLAHSERRIFGAELSTQAIAIARFMVARYQLPHLEYRDQAADKFLASWRKGTIDLVIADPPRAGMKECIPHLLRLCPRVILYISCDAATMARDIGKLARAYSLESVRGFDFFPQTNHVESIAVLKRIYSSSS